MVKHTRAKNLETCLVIATGLIIIFYFKPIEWLLYIAIIVGLIGAFFDGLANWITWFWYKLAEVMGFVMSKVILSIVFFIFLFPVAILYRLFNKESLFPKKNQNSYWVERNHEYEGKDLENVW